VKETEGTTLKIIGAPAGRRGIGLHVTSRNTDKDLALLKFDGDSSWPVAPLGNAAKAKAEEPILVLGFSQKVLVSAEGRLSGTPDPSADLWKTTAPINSGDSGAPAFDKLGRVIGIAKGGNPGAELQNVLVPISASVKMIRDLPGHEDFQKKAVLSVFLGSWQAKWGDSQTTLRMSITFTHIDRLAIIGKSTMDTTLLQGPARGFSCHFEESVSTLTSTVEDRFVVDRKPTKASPAELCDNGPPVSTNGEWKDFNHWRLEPNIGGGPALVFERSASVVDDDDDDF
jgi:hypothetical protein